MTSLFEGLAAFIFYFQRRFDDFLTWFILNKHSGKMMVGLALLVYVVIDRIQWHQRVLACIDFYHQVYDYQQCENYLKVLGR